MPKRVDVAAIRDRYRACGNKRQVADELGCSIPTVHRHVADLVDVAPRPQRRPNGVDGIRHRRSTTRHVSFPTDDRIARMPAWNNPALMEGRTMYPSTVRDVGGVEPVFKDGTNSKKIGSVIGKGEWRGMPVRTLTLEERSTCPQSCGNWRSCYGNRMQFATRWREGADLERRIASEIASLSAIYPRGFVVRLHNLGDFYSVEYVQLWADLLDKHEQLHAWGYSARWDVKRDATAAALVPLVLRYWSRFAIRFSDAPVDECSTVTIEHPYGAPADALICPEQVGKTESCATCALCWSTRKRIAFIKH